MTRPMVSLSSEGVQKVTTEKDPACSTDRQLLAYAFKGSMTDGLICDRLLDEPA